MPINKVMLVIFTWITLMALMSVGTALAGMTDGLSTTFHIGTAIIVFAFAFARIDLLQEGEKNAN